MKYLALLVLAMATATATAEPVRIPDIDPRPPVKYMMANPNRVNDGDPWVGCRSSPKQLEGNVVIRYEQGTKLRMDCQTKGQPIGYSGNPVWNKVYGMGCYLPDFYTINDNDPNLQWVPGVRRC